MEHFDGEYVCSNTSMTFFIKIIFSLVKIIIIVVNLSYLPEIQRLILFTLKELFNGTVISTEIFFKISTPGAVFHETQ
jgi:hypothetical protein